MATTTNRSNTTPQEPDVKQISATFTELDPKRDKKSISARVKKLFYPLFRKGNKIDKPELKDTEESPSPIVVPPEKSKSQIPPISLPPESFKTSLASSPTPTPPQPQPFPYQQHVNADPAPVYRPTFSSPSSGLPSRIKNLAQYPHHQQSSPGVEKGSVTWTNQRIAENPQILRPQERIDIPRWESIQPKYARDGSRILAQHGYCNEKGSVAWVQARNGG